MELGEESSDEASPVWVPCGTYSQDQTQFDPDYNPLAESTSLSRDDPEEEKSQVPNAMKECMALAEQMLPELVEESTASQSHQSTRLCLGWQKRCKLTLLPPQVPRTDCGKSRQEDGQSQRICPFPRRNRSRGPTKTSVLSPETSHKEVESWVEPCRLAGPTPSQQPSYPVQNGQLFNSWQHAHAGEYGTRVGYCHRDSVQSTAASHGHSVCPGLW